MEFQHRYFGETSAATSATASEFSFAPDTLREPTFFVGEVAEHLPFREAMSALHHVVVSDLRFKPKDRTAYFAWLKAHEQQLLTEALTQQQAIKPRLEAVRHELNELYKTHEQAHGRRSTTRGRNISIGYTSRAATPGSFSIPL